MTHSKLRALLAAVTFATLAVATCPLVLDFFLKAEYIGQPEERRYFGVLMWVAIGAAAGSPLLLWSRITEKAGLILYLVAVGLFVEGACALVVYTYTRQSHLPRWQQAFTFHPALVGVPTPGYRATKGGVVVSHNAAGFRGAAVGLKQSAVTRIVAIGGSTTYGVMVSDDETWPARLGQQLGPSCEVLNLGVPGHSSAEHLILTALRVSDLAPDYIVYYMGWNDLRNSHLTHLRSDYSDFHFLEQYGSLQVEQEYRSHSAVLFILKWILVRLGELDPPRRLLKDAAGRRSEDVDTRVTSIFERNVRELAALSRANDAEPIFVPQVLNAQFHTAEDVTWWAPLLPTRAAATVNASFGEAMRRGALATGSTFLGEILELPWQPEDFLDGGHLSVQGNRKFATELARALGPRCGRPQQMAAVGP